MLASCSHACDERRTWASDGLLSSSCSSWRDCSSASGSAESTTYLKRKRKRTHGRKREEETRVSVAMRRAMGGPWAATARVAPTAALPAEALRAAAPVSAPSRIEMRAVRLTQWRSRLCSTAPTYRGTVAARARVVRAGDGHTVSSTRPRRGVQVDDGA